MTGAFWPGVVRVVDLVLRVLGGLFALLLGAGSALLEAFSSAYRFLGLPAFWLIAVVVLANLFLVWFAKTVVGRPWAWWLPALAWFLIMVFAVGGTSEGDQIAGTWVGLITFAAGAFAFVAPAAFRVGRTPARGLRVGHGPGLS